MSGKEKVESQERLDQMELKVLQSLKVGEDEIEAVAGAPYLYDRVRSRIQAGPKQRRSDGRLVGSRLAFVPTHLNVRRPVLWTLSAAAVLLLVAALLFWRPGQSVESGKLGSSQQTPSAPQQDLQPSAPSSKPEPDGRLAGFVPAPNRSPVVSRPRRTRSRSTEVATEFFPLTFIADSAALETGHVVRVRIPRSALVTFGVPMNVDRAGELVKADVVIGDDGLARAIRFIQ